MASRKPPAFQFYPGDWRRDTALRSCSVAARGLWVDLMCLMHDGEPYGHLSVQGRALTDAQSASMVGLALPTYRKLLKELETAGVPSRDEKRCLYSRRMVRDEQVRRARAEGGPKSLENPNVPRPKGPSEGPPEGYPSDHPSGESFGGSPASASASATALTTPTTAAATENRSPGGIPLDLSAWVPAEYHGELAGALRASHSPDSLVAELRLIKQEPEARGLKGVTGPHVGQAIRDAALKNAKLSGRTLVAFIRGAQQAPSRASPIADVLGSVVPEVERRRAEREARKREAS